MEWLAIAIAFLGLALIGVGIVINRKKSTKLVDSLIPGDFAENEQIVEIFRQAIRDGLKKICFTVDFEWPKHLVKLTVDGGLKNSTDTVRNVNGSDIRTFRSYPRKDLIPGDYIGFTVDFDAQTERITVSVTRIQNYNPEGLVWAMPKVVSSVTLDLEELPATGGFQMVYSPANSSLHLQVQWHSEMDTGLKAPQQTEQCSGKERSK